MIEHEETRTLRGHPAVAQIGPEAAALQQAFYGRQLMPFDCGARIVQVVFEEVTATQVEMHWRVRCEGFDFELQFVEPAALFDLGSALAPGVPLALQRAAVLHAAGDLLQAVEQRLGGRIELIGLSGSAPAWNPRQALGMTVSRTAGTPGHPTRRCAVLLRALLPEGWQRLHRATRQIALSPPAHDVRLDIALHGESVSVTVEELLQIEPGDVLVLGAKADEIRRPNVSLKLGRQTVPGVMASITDGRVRITHAPSTPVAGSPMQMPMPTPNSSGDVPHQPWSTPMNSSNAVRRDRSLETPDTGDDVAAPTLEGMHPLDSVHVEIELELGRLSLPLSAVRALAVGQVFDTQQTIDGEGIVLWCGGQRLGVGQLVTVGERLAVRVAALHGVC